MKISSLYRNKRVFSLEVFPPKKDGDARTIYETLEGLSGIKPDFISVTYGAGGNAADRTTAEIARIIKRDYNTESMAHMTCVSTSEEGATEILDTLEKYGVENVLALRGDLKPDTSPVGRFAHASDLASFIACRGGFDIGGACYPEVHSEAASAEEDLLNLKLKTDAGATFLISQLFFDTPVFFRFLERARAARVDVPIAAGIMPITNAKQIERMVTMCGASIPSKLARSMAKYSDDKDSMRKFGIEYAARQITALVEGGVDGIHLYTMNQPETACSIYSAVKGLF